MKYLCIAHQDILCAEPLKMALRDSLVNTLRTEYKSPKPSHVKCISAPLYS